jgi:hypothetical protein
VNKITGFSVFVSMVLCLVPVSLSGESGAGIAGGEAPAGPGSGEAPGGLAAVPGTGRWGRALLSYTFSVNPLFGLFWGEGEEQVYDSGGSGKLQSQIRWDLKPLYYAGMSMEFARRDPAEGFGLFGLLSTKFGIPMNTGYAEDRDWFIPGEALTNFSRHDTITTGALLADLAGGLSMPVPPFLAFRFSLGLSYIRFSWTAYDGYIRYGKRAGVGYAPLEESDLPVPVSGAGLSYSQDWLVMPFGAALLIAPGRRFSGAIRWYVGPVFIFTGRDDHHLRVGSAYYGQFIDTIHSGLSLEPEGEFRFSPLEKFSLTLRLSWRSIAAGPRGASSGRRTGSSRDGEWQSLGAIAGGLLRILDAGIGVEVRL